MGNACSHRKSIRKLAIGLILALLVLIGWQLARRLLVSRQRVETGTAETAGQVPGEPLIEAVGEPGSKWIPSLDTAAVLTENALPAFRTFLRKLSEIGMSPLDPNLTTNKVSVVESGNNKYALQCRFIVDNKWVVVFNDVPETDMTRRFVGISNLEQTGPDNPYRAVSGGDTNRLAVLARKNDMPRETAVTLLQKALNSLAQAPVGEPTVFIEKYNGYELNRWRGRWWKPGADRLNQLNIGYEMAIATENPTQAVVVLYLDAVSGRKE